MEIETNKEKSSHYELVTESVEMCEICFNTNTSGRSVLCECGHTFCLTCFSEYYRFLESEGNVFPFKCPIPNCSKPIHKSLSYILDEGQLSRYHRLSKRHSRLCNPEIIWCPIINCDGFGMYKKEGGIKCNECEVEITTTVNPSSKELLSQLSLVECPGCKALISRTFGCMIIRCYCGTEFCSKCSSINLPSHESWVCLANDHNQVISIWSIVLFLLCPVLVPILPVCILYLYREHWDKNYLPILNEYPTFYFILLLLFSPMILVFSLFYLPFILSWYCMDSMFSSRSRKYSGMWNLFKLLIYLPSVLLVFLSGLLFLALAISFSPIYGLVLVTKKLGFWNSK